MSLRLSKPRKINKTKTFDKGIFKVITSMADKIMDFNTNSTIDKEKERITKNKTVSFKGIEIIEVESYKKYNQIPFLSLESIENDCIKAYEECRCILF